MDFCALGSSNSMSAGTTGMKAEERKLQTEQQLQTERGPSLDFKRRERF